MAIKFLNDLIASGEATFQVIPTVGTRTAGDSTTYAASTAFVTNALGSLSTPFEFNTTSTTGIQSIQAGYNANTASGVRSIAMGDGTSAGGIASTAMGYQTTASAGSSTAMGNSTEASGSISTAMGFGTEASGYASIAIGSSTEASGSSSTAMGSNTEASGVATTAMGKNTTASGFNSTAMGFGTTASGLSSVSMGQFNVINSSDTPTTFALTNTAFSIGNGTTAALSSDAFKVLFDGTTTIGTSTPISGSMFAVNRTSAATSATPTVGVFNDFNYTGSSSSIILYGGVTRNQYSGSDNIGGIIGTNGLARNLGSGDITNITGVFAQGESNSNSDFTISSMYALYAGAKLEGTGTQTLTQGVEGGVFNTRIDNPNATSASTTGATVQIEAVKGDMGDTTLLYLNMAGSYANPDASLSINNFAYIEADDNFAMPNVTGTSHFINSSVPLPSVFAGSVTSESLNVTALNTAPASATATGTLGSIKFTADHIYVCVATNTWKRVAIATF